MMRSMRAIRMILLLTVAVLTASCGGGGGGAPSSMLGSILPGPAAAPAVTKAEAYRFLNQATFGATEAEASRLMAIGDSTNAYARWLDAEFAKPASSQLPAVELGYPNPVPTGFSPATLHTNRLEQWFYNSLRGDDQLRQRVAFALSEIMVVSQVGTLTNYPFATADFYDVLARNAFGNFRSLLEQVSLHPAMGIYLNMLGNQKAVAGTNLRPDENYAREMMQLFTIGLVQLNIDGTEKKDASGQPLPSYTQDVVEGFARAFTGWYWSCPTTRPTCTWSTATPQLAPVFGYNQVKPMVQYAAYHETGSKQLLNYTGVSVPNGLLPAGQTGEKDLQDALDNAFNHPNVGPFLAKQLIQKLVTSNPSPAYVQRVAEKFNNDGTGVRGNLGAVIKAILLDAEARSAPAGSTAARAGKLKEPLLRATQFWRAYNANSASGKLGVQRNFLTNASNTFGQGPQQSPSVFNFFSPFHAPPGEIANGDLVAPEMQIVTEYISAQQANFYYTQAFARTHVQAAALNADDMYIDVTDEYGLATDSEALVNRVAERLLGGSSQISATLKSEVKAQIERTAVTTTNQSTALPVRVGDAIYLIVTSPEYALQR